MLRSYCSMVVYYTDLLVVLDVLIVCFGASDRRSQMVVMYGKGGKDTAEFHRQGTNSYILM
jgi:hypothetical protein